MNELKKEDISDISSQYLHDRVIEAFKIQKQRGQKELNGKLNDQDIKKYCILTDEAKDILDISIDKFQLSFRSVNKVLKVARTVADLDKSEMIEQRHIIESFSYRKR